MSSSLRNIVLFTAIALSTASPFQPLEKRQSDEPAELLETTFTEDTATCGVNGPKLMAIKPPVPEVLPQVYVSQDCDPVINAICQYAARYSLVPVETWDFHLTNANCEGHFYYARGPENLRYPTYDNCVASFQEISIGCMFPADGNQDALNGRTQYGVKNVEYIPADPTRVSDPGLSWTQIAASGGAGLPGYMVGAKGAFGAKEQWSKTSTDWELQRCRSENVRPPGESCPEGGNGTPARV
ncbi:MAG: hypothetical protein Q9169_002468 [Polycauliona sp. 2 TL-2023]